MFVSAMQTDRPPRMGLDAWQRGESARTELRAARISIRDLSSPLWTWGREANSLQ